MQALRSSWGFCVSGGYSFKDRFAISLLPFERIESVAGFIRKYYVLAQDGKTAGGIYLWNSQAEAQALYTESWKSLVREKYGCDPSVVYMDSPVVVDNLSHEIIADK